MHLEKLLGFIVFQEPKKKKRKKKAIRLLMRLKARVKQKSLKSVISVRVCQEGLDVILLGKRRFMAPHTFIHPIIIYEMENKTGRYCPQK